MSKPSPQMAVRPYCGKYARLVALGQRMSNTLYNLEQKSIPPDREWSTWIEGMRSLRREWDAERERVTITRVGRGKRGRK